MYHFQLNCSLSTHSDTYPPRHSAGVSVKRLYTSEGTQIPIFSMKSLLLMPGFFFFPFWFLASVHTVIFIHLLKCLTSVNNLTFPLVLGREQGALLYSQCGLKQETRKEKNPGIRGNNFIKKRGMSVRLPLLCNLI